MPETTLHRVIRVIAATQHYDAEKTAAITAGSTFEELGIDSLDGINIIFALENEFDVNIPDESAKSIRGVQDIVEGIEKLLAEKAESSG
ncbi:MAG: acyl carrier protein [Bryobacterales bacterium]|nr:acyl carrier protein [Bryobacterales bacterium]